MTTRARMGAGRRHDDPLARDDTTTQLGRELAGVLRWGRVRLHEQLCVMAGVQIDRSTLDILGAIRLRGALSRVDLCQILGLTQPTVSRQVSAAVASGHIAAATAPNDRLAKLSLTKDGARLQKKFADAYYELIATLTDDLDSHECAEFTRLLARLTARLDAAGLT